MKTVLIAALLLLILGWLFLRRSDKNKVTQKKPERRISTSTASTEYHAVSIRFSPKACAAAKEIDGKRFLSNAAPHIPLPGCDVVDCQCRFMHYKDRRARVDRRSVFTSSGLSATTGKFEQERRHGDDRRDDDDEEFF